MTDYPVVRLRESTFLKLIDRFAKKGTGGPRPQVIPVVNTENGRILCVAAYQSTPASDIVPGPWWSILQCRKKPFVMYKERLVARISKGTKPGTKDSVLPKNIMCEIFVVPDEQDDIVPSEVIDIITEAMVYD